MAYEVALAKAWSDLESVTDDKNIQVRFLSDTPEPFLEFIKHSNLIRT